MSPAETLVADPVTNQSDAVSSVPNVTYTVNASSALVTKVVDQGGNTRSVSFTPFDDVATSTNGESGETTSTFGANSGESLTSSRSPTGATSATAYGNSGTTSNPTAAFEPTSSTDGQKNATAYTYDGAGNLLQSTNALAATAKVTRNSGGAPATSTDPANGSNNTTYTYNSSHQLTTITPPTGNSLKAESLTYDGFGRVATVTDGDGNTVTYTYDLADRVTRAAYAGGADAVTVTYAYDGAGNLTTQADPSGTTTYAYDGRNLVTSRTATSAGGTLTYGYDADGNLTSATDAGGTTTYVYSDRNLMNQLTDPAGHLWEFAYNADGQRTKTWFNTNPAESAWSSKMVTSYDPGDRISGIQADEDSSISNVVSDVSYCYSKFVSGQSCPAATATTDTSLVQYATNNVTGTVSQFTYDKGNRLTKATSVNGSTTYAYRYDSDGNLTSGAAAGSLSYNSGNQITTSGYGYDGTGNLTSDPANGTLSYNDAGQLTAAGNAGGNGTENFAYAGTGQDQVLSDGTAAGITYGLAGQDGQPEVQSCTAHATGTSAPTYVLHDQQGTPLGMMRNGNVYAFITDNLGSVTHLIDTSGATDAAYAYDPYGNQVSQSGGEDLLSLLGYAGALTHPAPDQGAPATGYTHLGNRWQNPATATFRQQDNINKLASPASANTYTYAADNPANYTDPTGRGGIGSCIIDLTTGIGLGIFGVVSGFFGIATAETGVGLALGRPAYTQASPVLPSASTRLVTIAEMRHETAQTSTAMREMNRRKRVRISIALYVVAGICVIAGILFGVISNDTSGILISLIPGAAIAFSATSVLLGAKKR